MNPPDAVNKLAQDLAGEGMVVKATLIYDYIDGDGDRQLSFCVTDGMTMWDLDGLLSGVQRIVGRGYTQRG